jgi:hypothetical protein
VQQTAKLPLGGIVGRASGFAGCVNPYRFLIFALHLEDGRLPSCVVWLRQDPEAPALEL